MRVNGVTMTSLRVVEGALGVPTSVGGLGSVTIFGVMLELLRDGAENTNALNVREQKRKQG